MATALIFHSVNRNSFISFRVDDLLHRLHRIQPDALHDLPEHSCGLAAHQLNADAAFVSVENIVAACHIPEDDVRDLVAVLSELLRHHLMNLHPHAVLNRVLWRWYQSPSGFKPLRIF